MYLYFVLIVVVILFCFILILVLFLFFFFKQKTAYEMRISDWSSDVCSSDLAPSPRSGSGSGVARSPLGPGLSGRGASPERPPERERDQIGRASCRERVCQYV